MSSDIWRGKLQSFDTAAYRASVEVVGSRGYNLQGVPVSRGIAASAMTVGRAVMVAVADANNPSDAMVIGVW